MKLPLWFVAFALFAAACSASTSHIGSLKVGSDASVSTPASHFARHDVIYAQVAASNIADKVTVSFTLNAMNVPGQRPGAPIPAAAKSYDADSDSTITLTLTPHSLEGWPPGTYKLTATMTEDGHPRDEKSVIFTVA